jgi:hypothetical protein
MLDHAIAITHADRGLLIEPDASGGLRVHLARSNKGDNLPIASINPSQTAVNQAISKQSSVITEDLNFAGLDLKAAGGIRLDEQAAIGMRDGDGVVEHGAEHGLERELGVQQRRGFEKQVELAQAAGGVCAGGQIGKRADAGEQVGDLRLRGHIGRSAHTKDNVETVIDAEADCVAVAERVLLHLGAIHKHAVAIAPVFNAVAAVAHDNGGAMARDAAVGERNAVVDFAPANEERGMRDGDSLTRLVRGNHFNEYMG